jgi:hypothetical protein
MTEATTDLPGASVWEQDLYKFLIEHVEAERNVLEQCSAAAESTGSKAFRYLVDMLCQDEIRHHRIFNDLSESLKAQATMSGAPPAIPDLDFHRADHDAVMAATDELLESEETDLRELKRLHKQLRDVRDTTLWSLLVELMQRDTDKHIAILRFVRDHARAT